jgi:nitrite reductase/ring-hydroxylating ferredoxin subunit
MSDQGHEHDVAGTGDLAPGQSLTFALECDGRRVEAFLINYRQRFYAYVNRCRHLPLTLDWVENRFFSTDGTHLLCATHGAVYRPDTGECIDGPPCGRLLFRVPIRIVGTRILARCPAEVEE